MSSSPVIISGLSVLDCIKVLLKGAKSNGKRIKDLKYNLSLQTAKRGFQVFDFPLISQMSRQHGCKDCQLRRFLVSCFYL